MHRPYQQLLLAKVQSYCSMFIISSHLIFTLDGSDINSRRNSISSYASRAGVSEESSRRLSISSRLNGHHDETHRPSLTRSSLSGSNLNGNDDIAHRRSSFTHRTSMSTSNLSMGDDSPTRRLSVSSRSSVSPPPMSSLNNTWTSRSPYSEFTSPKVIKLSDLRNGMTPEIQGLLDSHEEAWRELIREEKVQHDFVLKQLQEAHAKALAQKEEEIDKWRVQERAGFNQELAAKEYSHAMETMKLESEIKALRSGNLQAQGGLVEEMNALRLTHEEALRDQQRRHEAQLLEVTMRQETTLKRLEENVDSLRQAIAAEIEIELQAFHEYQLMEQKLNHAEALKQQEIAHQEAMRNQRLQHEAELRALQMKHQEVSAVIYQ